jgi:N-acetylmuramoyl-L-alanine amidase
LNTFKLLFFLALFVIGFHFYLSPLQADKLDVVIIDPGHGGKDPGTIGLNSSKEKDINLSVGLKFNQLIQNAFPTIKTVLTRSGDDYIEVKDRTVIANSLKAKLFVSIHCNHKKEEETEKNGFEIYVLNRERFPEALEITMNSNSVISYKQYGADESAKYIFDALAQNGYFRYSTFFSGILEINMINITGLTSRGVYQSGFWVLLGASMSSVLIECGYLSDRNDEVYLTSDNGQNKLAQALFAAFTQFKTFYEVGN